MIPFMLIEVEVADGILQKKTVVKHESEVVTTLSNQLRLNGYLTSEKKMQSS